MKTRTDELRLEATSSHGTHNVNPMVHGSTLLFSGIPDEDCAQELCVLLSAGYGLTAQTIIPEYDSEPANKWGVLATRP